MEIHVYIQKFTFYVTQVSDPISLPPLDDNGSSTQQVVPGGSPQQPAFWLQKRKVINEQQKE